MSVVREEDYLILLIDSFIDFKNGILMLGYDLRIDAYTYFHLSPPLKAIQLLPRKIYQVKRKLTLDPSAPSSPDLEETQVEQKIKSIDPSKLNPIEKIYYTNYWHHKTKAPGPSINENVILAIGQIRAIDQRVSVLGAVIDLTVTCPEAPTQLVIRVHTNTFEINDTICFLLRKIPSTQGWSYRILGYKNKQQTEEYLNPDFRNLRNLEINPIDFR
ncbi:MAG: hypothetical protein JNL11_09250 [Bdellovibrionaceae bacterium]|nr:hypothetical protein [Pseudobdellovibrionaceae bacterium]